MTTPDPSADESFAAAFSPDPAVDAETSVVEPDDDTDDDLEVESDSEPTDEVDGIEESTVRRVSWAALSASVGALLIS